MAQFARPVSPDIDATNWTSTEAALYLAVNEVVADDAKIIQAADADVFEYDCEMTLGATITDPLQSAGHLVRVRAQKSDAFNRNLLVELRQGGATLASWTINSLTTSLQNFDLTLSGGEADSIVPAGGLYAGLSVRLTAKDGSLGHPNRPIVSQVYLQAPNPAFAHLDISGGGFIVAPPASGHYLTLSGGGILRVAGVEDATALVLDPGGGFKVHG